MKDDGTDLGARLFRALATSTGTERKEILLTALRAAPNGRVRIEPPAGDRTLLDGIDLSGESLSGLDLPGAGLRRAVFSKAVLEGCDLSRADLAGADFRSADLAECDLRGAMLEDADFRGARLRFAMLEAAVLEGAHLEDADLWGSRLGGVEASGALLTGANLAEANFVRADLAGANLDGAAARDADFSGADLSHASLQGADVASANFSGACLRGADLRGLDLTRATLAGVHLGGARLDQTRLKIDQIDGLLGDERSGDHAAAESGYLALERNFLGLGDASSSAWAYLRRRRMAKLVRREQARESLRRHNLRTAALTYARFLGAELAELLCDYGESVWRVLGVMVVVFVVVVGVDRFANLLLYTSGPRSGRPVHDLLQIVVFAATSSSSGSTPTGFAPTATAGSLVGAFHIYVNVALLGLGGFVLGNRIRR